MSNYLDDAKTNINEDVILLRYKIENNRIKNKDFNKPREAEPDNEEQNLRGIYKFNKEIHGVGIVVKA